MNAEEAAASRIVGKAVDEDGVAAEIDRITTYMASKSAIPVRLGLEAFAAQADLGLADVLPLFRGRRGAVLSTDDAREGIMAFLEKRSPKWTGK